MSNERDPRTQAIHKAATELVEELLASTKENTGQRWFHIIVRKMNGLPHVTKVKPAVNPKDPVLALIGSEFRFIRCPTGVVVEKRWCAGADGIQDQQIGTIREKDLAKLKLWLSGNE